MRNGRRVLWAGKWLCRVGRRRGDKGKGSGRGRETGMGGEEMVEGGENGGVVLITIWVKQPTAGTSILGGGHIAEIDGQKL